MNLRLIISWKDLPNWLKGGIILSVLVLATFLLVGLITAASSNWNCQAPPCSAATGSCTHSLQNCFEMANPVYNTYLNPERHLINGKEYSGNISSLLKTLLIQIITFFITGAIVGYLIGCIAKKIRRK